MSTQIILKVLALRHRLRQRERWTRRRLEAHQARELRLLRECAYARSPFYGYFHMRFSERPLHDLLILDDPISDTGSGGARKVLRRQPT